MLFAVRVDLNSKIVIDSHWILKELPYYIGFLTFRLLLVTIDPLLSNTKWITLLHSMFDVLTIIGNIFWKHGRIDLKSKRLNSFMVNNFYSRIPPPPPLRTEFWLSPWLYYYLKWLIKTVFISFLFYFIRNNVCFPH